MIDNVKFIVEILLVVLLGVSLYRDISKKD